MADDRTGGDLRDRDQRADAQRAVALRDDPVETGDAAQIDDAARLQQALLHQVEEVDAAGLDDDSIPGNAVGGGRDHGGGNGCRSRVRRFRRRSGIEPFEMLHGQLPRGMRPSAESTAAGVIGICRSRTPIAL